MAWLPFIRPHQVLPAYFFVVSILCQMIAVGLGLLIVDMVGSFWLALISMPLCAFGLAHWLKISLPWQIFNLLLIPAVAMWNYFEFSPMVPGVAVILIALLFLPTFWTRVPYFPTHRKMYEAILALLPKVSGLRFVDIGCGGGTLLAFLARRRPDAHFLGVEISPMAYFLSRLRTARLPQATVKFKSFWTLDLGHYDVVYAFLAPGPMPDIWEKAKREMRTGTLFISNTFEVPDEATQQVVIDESRQGRLFVYRMGARSTDADS